MPALRTMSVECWKNNPRWFSRGYRWNRGLGTCASIHTKSRGTADSPLVGNRLCERPPVRRTLFPDAVGGRPIHARVSGFAEGGSLAGTKVARALSASPPSGARQSQSLSIMACSSRAKRCIFGHISTSNRSTARFASLNLQMFFIVADARESSTGSARATIEFGRTAHRLPALHSFRSTSLSGSIRHRTNRYYKSELIV